MKKRDKKIYTVLGIVASIILVAGGYFLFFYQPQIEGLENGVSALINQRALQIKTDFNTDVLEDERLSELQLYGPSVIEVTGRGQNDNPFEPF